MLRPCRPPATAARRSTLVLAAGCLALLSAPALAGTISLEWDPVSDADLAGYKIYYGTAPNAYTSVVDVGNLTHYRLTGLSDCQQYSFAVKAYDKSGNDSAEFSNAVVGLPDPRLTSVTPTSAERGQSLTITVNGKNFEPGVSLSVADKVNVFYTSFVSCAQARATISVAGDATLSTLSATMTNPNGLRAALASAFTVLPVTYPFVTSVYPAPGSSLVSQNVKPTVSFSETMNPTTIRPDTVRVLAPSGEPVAQSPGYPSLDSTGKTATLKFVDKLQTGTLYRIDIQGGGSGVRDAQGTPMLTTITYGSGFMTDPTVQGAPLSVRSATPFPNDVGVDTAVEPEVTFSKPLDPGTITPDRIELRTSDGERVEQAAGSPSVDPTGTVVTILPANPLANAEIYSIRVLGGDAGVRDTDGLALDREFTQSPGFMTTPGDILPPPHIASVWPAEGDAGISIEVEPKVVFSQPMQSASVNSATVVLLDPMDQVVPQADGSPSLDACGETATVTPAEALGYSTDYRIKVVGGPDGVRNVLGGLLDADLLQETGFSTLPPAAFGPPAVTAVNPAEGAEAVPAGVHPTLTFSEAMDPTSISPSSVHLVGPDGGDVEQAEGSPILESSGRIVTMVPSRPLDPGASYRVVVEGGEFGVLDTEGEILSSAYAQQIGFRVDLPDLESPEVLGTVPEDGARYVDPDIHPTVAFSEPVDETTMSALTIVLLSESGTVVPQAEGSPALDATHQLVTITPAAPLDRKKTYKLQIVGGSEGVGDPSGNRLRTTVTQTSGFQISPGHYDNDDDDPNAGHD